MLTGNIISRVAAGFAFAPAFVVKFRGPRDLESFLLCRDLPFQKEEKGGKSKRDGHQVTSLGVSHNRIAG